MTTSSNPWEAVFKTTIERYCAHFNWQVAEATEEYAGSSSQWSPSGQTVYILRYESTLEFDVPNRQRRLIRGADPPPAVHHPAQTFRPTEGWLRMH